MPRAAAEDRDWLLLPCKYEGPVILHSAIRTLHLAGPLFADRRSGALLNTWTSNQLSSLCCFSVASSAGDSAPDDPLPALTLTFPQALPVPA